MTISTQNCKHIYQGDGETRVWELDFPVLSADHVQVLVTAADGTETVVSTGYEVNLAQGTVTYPTVASGLDVLAAGTQITLLRVTPPTQSINLTQQGVLDAEELENGYDKLTLQVQELAEKAERCIKYTASSGKTGADAAEFLAELNAAQTEALSNALDSVAQTQSTLEQAVSDEATARQSADLSLTQQLQTLSGLVSQRASEITAEATARQSADTALQTNKQDVISDLTTIRSGAAAGATALQPDEAASTYLSKTAAASTYIPLSQKSAASGVATLDSNTLIPSAQLPAATTSTKGAVVMDEALNSTSVNPLQNKEVFTRLSLIAPYIQSAAVRDFNEQEVVDATDLLAATGDLHALSLDLSANHSLQKLTAKGTSGKIANVSSVLVSNKAPLDNVTSPQIDVSYTGLNKAALVNLFNSMPYNVGYTTEGSPTITDGVASGLNDSNFLKLTQASVKEGNLDIKLKFTTGDNVTTSQYPFSWESKADSTNRACGIYISSSKYGFLCRETDDTNHQWSNTGGAVISANTTYFMHVLFTTTDKSLKVGISDHDGDYTYGVQQTLTNNLCLFNGDFWLPQIGRAIPSNFSFPGSIDLNYFSIKIDGITWFDGKADVTKTVSVVGCSGTEDLTAEDKAIAEDKGWAITLS